MIRAENDITLVRVDNGADGYSPTVSTGTAEDGSTTITVTNKDGSTTTELVDGTARTDAENALDFKVDISDYNADQTARDAELDTINNNAEALAAAVAKELVGMGYAEITDVPSLILGKINSAWKVVITNNAINLQKNSSYVASLAQDADSPQETTLKADNARLSNVKFRSANGGGKLGIIAQSNGHVSLKEI